jgi:DNA-binding transcriptional ArsR family regulator
MPAAKLPLSEKMLELVARRFKLLGEPLRLRILQLLEPGETTVNDIVQALEANQSNVSKHLGLLYDGGLVGRRRDRNSIYYFIADPVVFQICALVCHSASEDARTTLAELSQPRKYATAGKGKGKA